MFSAIAWITGLENLLAVALKHTTGHFTEYGGSIVTETDWMLRFYYLMNTIWADGLGGYWINRTFASLLLSFLLIPMIILTINKINLIIKKNKNIYYLILATLIYLIWIFLFKM